MSSPVLLLCVLVGVVCTCLCCAIAICYFHANTNNFHRVRSKVYRRLYAKDRFCRPVCKSEFASSVQQALHNEEQLNKEFQQLEEICLTTIHRRSSCSSLWCNSRRNRYNDIVPYDANRVALHTPVQIEGETQTSDYVNASFIPNIAAADKGIEFIAAQGPCEDTCSLLWELIWQHNLRVIVMLTNLVEGFGFNAVKCSQYWPDIVGQTKKFGNLSVLLYELQPSEDYTVRKLSITRLDSSSLDSQATREIVQVQFTSWPDRSAPSDPDVILQLLEVCHALSKQYNSEAKTPWLVHCSAGVGRTGTFIAIDQLSRQILDPKCVEIDVFHHIYNLRKCRRYMVQSPAQYVYIYKCLLELIKRKEDEEKSKSTSLSTI